jgi:hypothetical protein
MGRQTPSECRRRSSACARVACATKWRHATHPGFSECWVALRRLSLVNSSKKLALCRGQNRTGDTWFFRSCPHRSRNRAGTQARRHMVMTNGKLFKRKGRRAGFSVLGTDQWKQRKSELGSSDFDDSSRRRRTVRWLHSSDRNLANVVPLGRVLPMSSGVLSASSACKLQEAMVHIQLRPSRTLGPAQHYERLSCPGLGIRTTGSERAGSGETLSVCVPG